MRTALHTLLLAVVLPLLACSSSDTTSPAATGYIGAWAFGAYEDATGMETYRRVDALDGDRAGIEFRRDGVAVKRTHGWCGTPPRSYFNVAGIWEEVAPSTVRTEIDEGLGPAGMRWEIASVIGDLMQVRVIHEEGP